MANEQPEDRGAQIIKQMGMVAMKTIFSKPTSDTLIEMLKAGGQDPSGAIAQGALSVLNKIKKETTGVDPELAFSVSMSVVVWIMELGEMAGAIEPDMALLKSSLNALAKLKQSEGGQATQGGAPATPAGAPPGILNAAQPVGA